MVKKKNSADSSMGRRPEFESDELYFFTILVGEIFAILCLKPLKKCYTIREHDPIGIVRQT